MAEVAEVLTVEAVALRRMVLVEVLLVSVGEVLLLVAVLLLVSAAFLLR